MTTRTTTLLLALLLLTTGCGDAPPGPETPPRPGTAPEPATPTVAPGPPRVRPAALAGRGWYPGDRETLAATVDGFLDLAPEWEGDAPLALVAPHAGYTYAGPQQGRVYKAVKGRSYRRVFLLGVPHRARVDGVSIPDVTHYATPLGDVPVDREAADRLLARGSPFFTHRTAHDEEHSIEIHLPFLLRSIGEFFLVPMLVGTDPETASAVAAALAAEIRPGDLVVASSDSTHYGPRFGYLPFENDADVAKRLEELDLGAAERVLDLDFPGFVEYHDKTDITICGFAPICVLLKLLPPSAHAELTGYGTSGDRVGDFENSVSYVGIAFTGPAWGTPESGPRPLTKAEETLVLTLARRSMETWVRERKRYDPRAEGLEIPARLTEKSGCFVTLTKGKRLRGCIGDILPERPLFEAVLARAISSAANDPRFSPVREEELEQIEIEVSVLTPPRSVALPEQIEIGKHGILLSFEGRRRSVYLPQVAPEQGWDLAETLSHLSEKGGLPASAWQSSRASFEVFTAQVFDEGE